MASYNRVILMGNLTRDPEVRYLPSGKAVADLGLAMSSKYRTQDGEQHEDVCFVTCVVYGKQAENCGQYLSRGRQILVEGRLHYEQWEKDGQKRNALKVVADRVQFLGGGNRGGDSQEAQGGGAQARPPRRAPAQEPAAAASEGPAASAPDAAPAQEPAPESGDDDNLPF